MTNEELAKRLAKRIFEMGGNGRGLIRSELEEMLVEELKAAEKPKPADKTATTFMYGVI